MPSLARTLTAAALPCALVVALPAAATPGDQEKSSHVAVSGAVTRLVVDLQTGSVTVRSGKVAAVDITKHWQGTEPTVDVKASNGVLTVSGRCPGLIDGPLVYAGSPLSTCTTDVVVTVPGTKLDTQVDTYGAVALAGFTGKHDLSSGTGAVTVRGTSGSALSVTTNGGNVSLKDLTADSLDVSSGVGSSTVERVTTRGTTKVSANGGSVQLTQLRARSVDVSSGTGDQTLSTVTTAGALTLSSNGGGVTLRGGRAGSADISAGTGAVTLTDLTVAAPLTVRTNGAPLSVRSSKAPSLDLASGTGRVQVDEVKTGKVAITTNGGDVVSSDTPATTFDVSSGTGAVNLATSVAPSKVTVRTNNGDVTVTVPRGAYSLVVSQSGGGRLVLDGVTPDSRSSHKLDLSSGSADITVRGR